MEYLVTWKGLGSKTAKPGVSPVSSSLTVEAESGTSAIQLARNAILSSFAGCVTYSITDVTCKGENGDTDISLSEIERFMASLNAEGGLIPSSVIMPSSKGSAAGEIVEVKWQGSSEMRDGQVEARSGEKALPAKQLMELLEECQPEIVTCLSSDATRYKLDRVTVKGMPLAMNSNLVHSFFACVNNEGRLEPVDPDAPKSVKIDQKVPGETTISLAQPKDMA